MHELAITKKLISLIEKEANNNNIIPNKAFIEIGRETTYKHGPIEFYFSKLKNVDCKLIVRYIEGNDIILRKIEGKHV